MFKYVHHICYAVKDRDELVEYMDKTFGMKPCELSEAAGGLGREAHYRVGPTLIRFKEPATDPGANPTPEFLEKHGPGPYLVSWAVDDIVGIAKRLRAQGLTFRDEKGYRLNSEGYYVMSIGPEGSHAPPFFQLAEDPK